MKKLGKLSINPEKLMKSEELVNLRGGYGGSCGPGFIEFCCTIKPCFGCSWIGPATVCSLTTNVEATLRQYYPELYEYACAQNPCP